MTTGNRDDTLIKGKYCGKMQKIKFLGASGDVTGSSYLLTASDNTEVLIDFGMFQGPKKIDNLNYQPLQFSPSRIKGVLLTHAHLDHCGRLPLLVFNGYFAKIYMTAPTRALVEVVLRDAAKVAENEFKRTPLYGIDEVEKVLQMIEVINYDQEFRIGSFAVTYKDAGHILGSASIEIIDTSSKNKDKIVFSGDLGNSPEDIVKPTEYIDASDFVVMETTYGDKIHPKENATRIIQEEINIVEKTGGVLLVPAFSIERTQELLHHINHLKKDGLVRSDTPVFLDSPMGILITEIFKDFKSFYNDELLTHTDNPFGFEGLVITEEARDSKEIIQAMNPKVIIAGSGMMNGGRIIHHVVNYISRDTTRVLFVGFQAEETLGRRILEGARNIWIDKTQVKVRAKIREIASMSSHADQLNLLKWLIHIRGVKKVFLTHGEEKPRKIFAEKIKQANMMPAVFLPEIGQELPLQIQYR